MGDMKGAVIGVADEDALWVLLLDHRLRLSGVTSGVMGTVAAAEDEAARVAAAPVALDDDLLSPLVSRLLDLASCAAFFSLERVCAELHTLALFRNRKGDAYGESNSPKNPMMKSTPCLY
jgi:hypothetical protein